MEEDQRESYFEPEPEEDPGSISDDGNCTGSTNSLKPPSIGGDSYFQPEPEDDTDPQLILGGREDIPPSPDPSDVPGNPRSHRPARPRGRDCVKCVVVGDDRVGKTSLLATYGTGQFPKEHIPTVFEPFQVIQEAENQSVWSMKLHDTARQEDYDSERVMTYVGADVVIITYSVTSPTSFANIRTRWIPEVQQHAGQAPIVIVATKSDLRTSIQACQKLSQLNLTTVTQGQGQKMAKKVRAVGYRECSALMEPEGLKALFDSIFKVAMTNKLENRKKQKLHMHKSLLRRIISFDFRNKDGVNKTNKLIRRDS